MFHSPEPPQMVMVGQLLPLPPAGVHDKMVDFLPASVCEQVGGHPTNSNPSVKAIEQAGRTRFNISVIQRQDRIGRVCQKKLRESKLR